MLAGHGRPWGYRGICVFVTATLASAASAAPPVDPVLVRPLWEDAELTDIQFVDATHGWSIGDRGVVWRTSDGGGRWEPQSLGLDVRLESAQFLDANHGWIAGGAQHPWMRTSSGALFRTRDGGATWQADQAVILPALRRAHFFNGAHGWAFGESSALFPSGVFTTENGGRNWTPLPHAGCAGWLAGDLIDPQSGVLAGRSELVTLRQRGIEPAISPPLGLRNVRRVRLAPPRGGWLVGDGGLVLTTNDLGRSWQTPSGELPSEIIGQFDWRALAVRGSRCWIAGSPGSHVLHSADGGQSWESFATGQTLPVSAIEFVDDQRGWAAGSLGTILTTTDGGRTWGKQRGGGSRVALLGLFAESDDVPLELFSRLSASEGYLAAVHLFARRDAEAGADSTADRPQRAAAALRSVGASRTETDWAFPLRQRGLALSSEQVVAAWDRLHAGRGLELLERHFTREIRTWRPDVVVTTAARAANDDPLAQLIQQAVVRAAAAAADESRFPEQVARLGLSAWKVKKVYGALPAGAAGTTNLATSQLSPRLGLSLSDHAAEARGLIGNLAAAPPTTRGFRLLVNHLPQELGEQDFMAGITLAAPSDARRALPPPPAQGIDAMKRIAEKHRNIQAILAHSDRAGHDSARFLASIGELTRDLDERAAGDVLFDLGQSYHRTGKWELAAETLRLLPERYPQHRRTPPALVWLIHYWSSGEGAWRAARKGPTPVAPQLPATASVEQLRPLGQVLPDVTAKPVNAAAQAVRAANYTFDSADRLDRPAIAAQFGQQLERLSAAGYADPMIQFPLGAADRAAGAVNAADRLRGLSGISLDSAWTSCAEGEKWLADAQGDPPKSVVRAARATERPRLDGQLDDAVWVKAKPVELHSALRDDAQWPAVAIVAHDEEFVYVAFNCRFAPGAKYDDSSQKRPRDADLSANDRVEIYLDVDRDWVTCYRLSVDHRGWTADTCWGDKTWNPRWFVAAQRTDDAWTIEAAIPRGELCGPAGFKQAWGLGLQRIVPGVGFQSWTQPAAIEPAPQGFGYMMFE